MNEEGREDDEEDVGEGVDVLEAVGLECTQFLEALPGVRVRVRGVDLGLG